MINLTPNNVITIPAREKIQIPVLEHPMGAVLGGIQIGGDDSTVKERRLSTIADAVNVDGNYINDLINARLDTSTKEILDGFSFGASGAIQIGTYVNGVSGDIKISPNGLVARNSAGANTIAINGTTGEITAIKLVGATGSIGGWNIISGYLYNLTSGTPSSNPSDGIVIASGNKRITVYENTEKRVEIGNLPGGAVGTYGIRGYDNNGSTVLFEISQSLRKIAGWLITSTTLANGTNIILDAGNSAISINDATYGNSGIQLQYNSGTPRMYVGDGSLDYFKYDGTNVSISCSSADAIIIKYGSDILLEHGGDIKFTSVTAPTACTAQSYDDEGNLNGTYYYKITYVNEAGETELGAISNVITVTNTPVQLVSIPTSSSNSVTSRKIYRTKAGGTDYYLVDTIADNTTTTYLDNIADGSLPGHPANNMKNESFGKIFVDGQLSFRMSFWNTGIGQHALASNTTGYRNTAVGSYALEDNNVGRRNTAIGNAAMYQNTTGYYHTVIGQAALLNNTTGNANTVIGCGSMETNITGGLNVAIGYQAGFSNINNYNIYLGYQAGYSETGSNKLYIDNSNTATPLIYGEFDNNLITVNGNFGVGTKVFGTSAVNVLAIKNGTIPSSSPADEIQLYAEDVGGSSELKVRDEAGNITTLSPHNFTLFKPDKEHFLPFSYYSKNPYLGKEINIDMYGAIQAIEKLTGKKFIYTNKIEKENWDTNQKLNESESEKEIKRLKAINKNLKKIRNRKKDESKNHSGLESIPEDVKIPKKYIKKQFKKIL